MSLIRRLFFSLGVAAAMSAYAAPTSDDFQNGSANWVIEQMPGGGVVVAGGSMRIEDQDGCTVWWKYPLRVPFKITYEATVIDNGGPNDRVSDLNCFWLATDARSPENIFFEGHGRTGKFEDYDVLRTYYVGQGGNTNSTTRFRRYAGDGVKPLLPEHDRREPAMLLEGNRPYRITITADESGRVRYLRDDVLVFEFEDQEPYREGWFGFRTVRSHLRISDFRITK